MTPFQRGKALKKKLDLKKTASQQIAPGFPQKDVETRRREDGVEFTGRFKNGKLNGVGVMVFPDGRRYKGDFRDGVMEGNGIMEHPSGAVYEGQFKRNKRHGMGVMTFADGFKYKGHFREGKSDGRGSLYFPDGATYHGQFENGRFNGHGELTFPDGAWYKGQFKDDRRHGPGVMTLPNGFKYDGQFVNNRPEGHGELTYPGGASYTGRLKAGKCHGYGRLIYGNGLRYEGYFKEGRYHGNGRLIYPDGTIYEGWFQDDQLQDHATITRPNGEVENISPGKIAVVGKKPEESAFLIDIDIRDLRLQEEAPDEKSAHLPPPPGPLSENTPQFRHRTADGHFVGSKEEVIIDNWLYMAGIRHVPGKRLPLEEDVYVGFYLPEGRLCLEYWPESGEAKDRNWKRRVYQNNHFNLIELKDEDFYNLDDVLSQKLLSCGIRAI